jgi:hypothetical protein
VRVAEADSSADGQIAVILVVIPPGVTQPVRNALADDLPDVSCKDGIAQHPVDDPLLSCKQQVGVRAPRHAP